MVLDVVGIASGPAGYHQSRYFHVKGRAALDFTFKCLHLCFSPGCILSGSLDEQGANV
jgi:hypothetical protein